MRSGSRDAAFSASILPHVSPMISMPSRSRPCSDLVSSRGWLRKMPTGRMPCAMSAAADSPCAMIRVGTSSAVYVLPSPEVYVQAFSPDASPLSVPRPQPASRSAAAAASRVKRGRRVMGRPLVGRRTH
jgi:hypothetical protein